MTDAGREAALDHLVNAAAPKDRDYNLGLVTKARGELLSATHVIGFTATDTSGSTAQAVHDVVEVAPVHSVVKPENKPAGMPQGIYVTAQTGGIDEGIWQIASMAKSDPQASSRLRGMSVNNIADEIMMMNGLAMNGQIYPSIAPGTALIVDVDRLVANNAAAASAMGGKPFFISRIKKEDSQRMVDVPVNGTGYTGVTMKMPESQLTFSNTIVSYATLPFAPAIMGLNNVAPKEDYYRVSYNPVAGKWETTMATQADLDAYAQLTATPRSEINIPTTGQVAKAVIIPSATAVFLSWAVPGVA